MASHLVGFTRMILQVLESGPRTVSLHALSPKGVRTLTHLRPTARYCNRTVTRLALLLRMANSSRRHHLKCSWKPIISCLDCRKRSKTSTLIIPKEFVRYPTQPPPPPQDILTHREQYEAALYERRFLPHPRENDTPLLALYRLYETIVLDWNIGMRNEIEYFWNRHAWKVNEIPDPADAHPARYAIMACIPSLLVEAFNHNISLGLPRSAPSIMSDDQIDEMRARPKVYENLPSWVNQVPKLDELLRLPHHSNLSDTQVECLQDVGDKRASPAFLSKNILLWQPHIFFI